MSSRPAYSSEQDRNQQITDIRRYRKTRRKAGRYRWILSVVFAVACLFAGYFFALSPFFAVREITVSGNAQVDSQRIIHLSGVQSGDNIFAVNRNAVAQWLKIEPKIKTADISRSFGGKLTILVTERQAVAFISTGNAFIDVDTEGRVLSRYTTLASYHLPLITGLDQKIDKIAAPGCFLETDGLADALDILVQLQAYTSDIGEINVADVQQIRLYTLNGVEVRIGDKKDIADKYLVASAVIANHSENGSLNKISYIDVSAGQAVVCYNR